jgi:hypothetical protein
MVGKMSGFRALNRVASSFPSKISLVCTADTITGAWTPDRACLSSEGFDDGKGMRLARVITGSIYISDYLLLGGTR